MSQESHSILFSLLHLELKKDCSIHGFVKFQLQQFLITNCVQQCEDNCLTCVYSPHICILCTLISYRINPYIFVIHLFFRFLYQFYLISFLVIFLRPVDLEGVVYVFHFFPYVFRRFKKLVTTVCQ